MLISLTPPILTLHLKRFQQVTNRLLLKKKKKCVSNTYICIQLNLNLTLARFHFPISLLFILFYCFFLSTWEVVVCRVVFVWQVFVFSFCDWQGLGRSFPGEKKNVLLIIEATLFGSLLEMCSFTEVTTYCIKWYVSIVSCIYIHS